MEVNLSPSLHANTENVFSQLGGHWATTRPFEGLWGLCSRNAALASALLHHLALQLPITTVDDIDTSCRTLIRVLG